MKTEDIIHLINELNDKRTKDGFKSMLMFITPDGKHVGFANNLADSPYASLAMLKACVSDVLDHANISDEAIVAFQDDIEKICTKKLAHTESTVSENGEEKKEGNSDAVAKTDEKGG